MLWPLRPFERHAQMRRLPPPASHADQQHEFARRDRGNHEPAPIPPSSPRTLQVSRLRLGAPFEDTSDRTLRNRVPTSDPDRSPNSLPTSSFVQTAVGREEKLVRACDGAQTA